MKKSDFEKMCLDLEKRSKKIDGFECISDETSNEIILARKAVKKYINGDKNRLLKLKAQAIRDDYMKYYGNIISAFALSASILSLTFSFSSINKIVIWELLLKLFFLIILIIVFYLISKLSPINSWRQYILVVIEEIEKTF